jgi:arylsulfatase
MDFGKDLQSPVSQSYQPPFAFTGVVEKVVLDIK